jgi:hypothetical protein
MYKIQRNLFAEVLEVVPGTDWCSTWDAGNTNILRRTSKNVKNLVDKICPATDVVVNTNYWKDVHNGTSNEKIEFVKRKILSLATLGATCHIRRIVLPRDMNIQLGNFREVFEHCKNLPNLSFYNNDNRRKINAIDVANNIDVFEQCLSLNICNNDIGTEGTEILFKALTHCAHLNICSNNIGTAGVDNIVKCKTLTRLTHLNLCNNEIVEVHIDKLLFQNTGLTNLNLSQNHIFTLTYDSIAIQSKSFALLNLDIAYNHLGAEGATSLAGVLPQCPALTDLNIAYNFIEEDGGSIIAEVIGNCSHLSSLCLISNNIGKTGIDKMVMALSRISSLTELSLGRNMIAKESIADIKDFLGHRVTIS